MSYNCTNICFFPVSMRFENKKDPNAPKAPLTSYFLFTAKERPKIKAEDPKLSFGEIAKLIGQRWKEIDPETKERFTKMAEDGN